jgi:hypothetical protein
MTLADQRGQRRELPAPPRNPFDRAMYEIVAADSLPTHDRLRAEARRDFAGHPRAGLLEHALEAKWAVLAAARA